MNSFIKTPFWENNQKREETLRGIEKDVAVKSFSFNKNPYILKLSRLKNSVEILSYLDDLSEQYGVNCKNIQEAIEYSKKILPKFNLNCPSREQVLQIDVDFNMFLEECSKKSKISENTRCLLDFLLSDSNKSWVNDGSPVLQKHFNHHTKAALYALLKPKQTLEKS